jgi:hypothetical protein
MLLRIGITMTVEPTLYSVAEAENKFYSYNLSTGFFSAGHPTRKLVNDISFCNTDGCNAPAADSCALAGAPAVAAVRFGGLNAADSTKFDTDATSGKRTLKAAAVAVLQASIQTAVQANACATCTVKVTSVVEDSTGNVLFQAPSSSRRLQAASSAMVTFATSGGTTAQLAAVTTASTSAAFTAAVTFTVASVPGFSGVTASAATPAQSGGGSSGGGSSGGVIPAACPAASTTTQAALAALSGQPAYGASYGPTPSYNPSASYGASPTYMPSNSFMPAPSYAPPSGESYAPSPSAQPSFVLRQRRQLQPLFGGSLPAAWPPSGQPPRPAFGGSVLNAWSFGGRQLQDAAASYAPSPSYGPTPSFAPTLPSLSSCFSGSSRSGTSEVSVPDFAPPGARLVACGAVTVLCGFNTPACQVGQGTYLAQNTKLRWYFAAAECVETLPQPPNLLLVSDFPFV